jgi:hypothetical protein
VKTEEMMFKEKTTTLHPAAKKAKSQKNRVMDLTREEMRAFLLVQLDEDLEKYFPSGVATFQLSLRAKYADLIEEFRRRKAGA